MYQKKVSLLSISDCTEKNGIVTFIRIFIEQHDRFSAAGFDLSTICYRDFPAPVQQLPSAAACEGYSGRAPMPTFTARLKPIVKRFMLAGPHRAFFMFACTLAKRGLVVAVKAKAHGRAEIYFHQDFLTAFWTGLMTPAGAKHVLVLHSGIDPLKHLFIWFSPLLGTRYESLIRSVFAATLRRQRLIVTLSQALGTQLKSDKGVARTRCIYNAAPDSGVSRAPQAVDNRRVNFVAVGSLQYVKGFDLLLDAIGSLEPEYRNLLKLVIVGEGGERASLEQQIAMYNLQEHVRLAGISNDVPSYLSEADVYVLSSRDEGLPIAIIEAMQIGLPLISTPVGTIPEIIDESACVFVAPDVVDIAKKLRSILDGEFDLKEMGRASRHIYENKLSMDKFVGSYLDLFTEVSSEKART